MRHLPNLLEVTWLFQGHQVCPPLHHSRSKHTTFLGEHPHLPTDPDIHQITASEGPHTVSIKLLDCCMLEVLEEDCAMDEPKPSCSTIIVRQRVRPGRHPHPLNRFAMAFF